MSVFDSIKESNLENVEIPDEFKGQRFFGILSCRYGMEFKAASENSCRLLRERSHKKI